ncbi:hypothetical protein WJX73_005717 [Symbiochloris irregularis]|uniref:Uncharacterized protein n=1 Tax=Symbiochloris irregularis TaxID=706552 RepID=A0AAW1P9K3_9CHLO
MTTHDTVAMLLPGSAPNDGLSGNVAQLFSDRLAHRRDALLQSLYAQLQGAASSHDQGAQATQQLLVAQQGLTGTPQEPLLTLAATHQDLVTQRLAHEEALQVLRQQAALQAQLTEFDALLASGAWKQAAEAAAAFPKTGCPALSEEAAHVQQACQQRLDLLEQTLQQHASASIRISAQAPSHSITVSRLQADQLWPAMASIGTLHSSVATLVEELTDKLFQPLLSSVGDTGPAQVQASDARETAVFEWVSEREDASTESAMIEDVLCKCLHFLADHLFKGIAAEAGAQLWPALSQLYTQHRLQAQCEAVKADLGALQQVAAAAEAIEKEAAALGFYTFPGPIHTFCQAALHILNWGSEGEEASLLARGQYSISAGCQALLALMHTILERACLAGSSSVAQALCAAVSDAALLKCLLPPEVHARQLQVPHVAALHAMDCQHLAQHLLLMPHCYQHLTQKKILTSLHYHGPAQQLQQATHACLTQMERQQVQELGQLLEAARGFRRLHEAQAGIAARRAIARVLHTLSRLGNALKGVLDLRTHAAVAGRIVDAVCGMTAGSILAMQSIGSEESEDLARIIAPLTTDAVPSALGFPQASATAPAAAKGLHAAAVSSAEAHAPQLLRLKELHFMLTARLIEIRDWSRAGRLRASGLAPHESAHMVRALFEDTENRRRTLEEL